MDAGWSFAAVAALTWGAAGFLAGQAARRGAMTAVLLGTQVAGLVTMLVVATIQTTTGHGSPPDQWLAVLPWAALAGGAELLGFAALYLAMQRGPMGIAAPVAGLGVVVPVLFGLINGGGLGSWQLIGLGVAVSGMVLLTRNSEAFGVRNLGIAGLSGVSFGIALVALSQGAQLDEVASGTLMRAVTVPVVVIAWWLRPRRVGRHALVRNVLPAVPGRRIDLLPVLVLALLSGVFDALGNLAFAMASTRTSLTVAALIGSLDPLVTAMLARFLIAETATGRPLGALAAVVGAALTSSG